MSVEKQIEEKTAPSPEYQREKDQEQPEDCMDSSLSETSQKAPEAQHSNSSKQMDESTNRVLGEAIREGVRQWFKNLADDERVAAMGFTDGPFLVTILHLISWSKAGDIAHAVEFIPWGMTLPLNELASTYAVAVDQWQAKPLKVASVTSSLPGVSDGKVNSSYLNNANTWPRTASDLLGEALFGNSNTLRQLFQRMCAIFPSAFKQMTSCSLDSFVPTVTVDPSFGNVTGEELLLALDVLANTIYSEDFLSFTYSFDSRKEPNWLRRLSKNFDMDASVPLIALVLARFECALIESFLNGNLDAQTMDRSLDDRDGSLSAYATPDETEQSERVVASRKFENNARLLQNMYHHARRLDEIERTMDRNEVADIMQNFSNACVSTDGPKTTFNVQTLILTPLAWISACTRSKEMDMIDFGFMDTAVDEALQRISIHTTSEYDEHKSVDPTPSRMDSPNQSHRRKRKKHKKKNKNRKNSMSDQHTVALIKSHEIIHGTLPDAAEGDIVSDIEARTTENRGVVEPNVILRSVSVDSDDTIFAPESVSVNSEVSNRTESIDDATLSTGGIRISRVDGVIAVAPPIQNLSSLPNASLSQETSDGYYDDDGDTWATVEARGRGNRKKMTDRPSLSLTKGTASDLNSRKPKSHRTPATRRKSANRKMVREILTSLLDRVDDEARKKKHTALRSTTNPWKIPVPPAVTLSPQLFQKNSASSADLNPKTKEKILRDVVVGAHSSSCKNSPPVDKTELSTVQAEPNFVSSSFSKESAATKRGKSHVTTPADQNTAPTYQETVSAVSSPSNAAVESKTSHTGVEGRKSDSSSGGTDEAPQNIERVTTPIKKDNGQDPPLPTLLSPENANSATSSVASSLEVPHTSHRHHVSNSNASVNDVGYHLLDVCDRLSRDMSLFMSKRAVALDARRRERGALLIALQDSVSSIWPGRCHVELYGSCATQLDLPSSDLDVVVVGLGHNADASINMTPSPLHQGLLRSKSVSSESIGNSQSFDEVSLTEEKPSIRRHNMQPSAPPYVPIHQYVNAERVLALASELEKKPWAVQVNPIPTASVPVVKVLADPSKLTRTSTNNDWMSYQQQMASQGTIQGDPALPSPPFEQTLQPWRGSDVMNGLFSLDITFEGPGHGGIGSTEYSLRAVAEVCHGMQLQPDATPFVQVLMVLKELLAQRKLNEPYSGGLSSYALLLLVVALLREREVIKAEIERIEWQRRAMATGDASLSFSEPSSIPAAQFPFGKIAGQMLPDSNDYGDRKQEQSESLKDSPFVGQKDGERGAVDNSAVIESTLLGSAEAKANHKTKSSSQSSWASIAKKSAVSTPSAIESDKLGEGPSSKSPAIGASPPQIVLKQKHSFAEAARTAFATYSAGSEQDSKRTGADRNDVKSGDHSIEYTSKTTTRKVPGDVSVDPIQIGLTPSTASMDSSMVAAPSFFSQGYTDIIEVLCSGETTAGKLLMHFLLYYSQHFDAQATAIDLSGKHERGFMGHGPPYSYFSPYIPRRATGTIDPITGMLTVDPIVVYDPLEGAEHNNVARRCFAWNSVRWIFAQSYATLSSAVERSATPPTTPAGRSASCNPGGTGDSASGEAKQATERTQGDLMDPTSPLLRCLLSF